MEKGVVTLTENDSVEATNVPVETEDVSFETGDVALDNGAVAHDNGDQTFENGDGALENGGLAFESVPNETGFITEVNGAVDAAVENSNTVKQDMPTEIGTETDEKRWPGWPGESVFRILIPVHKVGVLIGRKGEFIKKICDETKARIKVLDGPKGVPERAVIISAKEEFDASLPPAIDGLLRVHKRIIDGLDGDPVRLQPGTGNQGPTRLLVAAAQAGSLIGKHGATIKSIQEDSSSVVRVVENLPPVALHDDRVVEIVGEPNAMHKAVELIANHLRKFLVDRSVLPLFERHMSMPNFPLEHNMLPQSWGPPHGHPSNGGGAGYGGNPHFMPSRPHDNFYPPADFPPPETQSHHGLSMYGQNGPATRVHASANPQPSMVSQVTHHMEIPLIYADAVIGVAGANISYIRRASGATITIQESRMAPGDMTVEISGTATQVQTAEQLMQNFMADAAAPNTTTAGNQSYNSYAEQGLPVYGSPPSNPVASAHVGSVYGSSYGTSYGY